MNAFFPHLLEILQRNIISQCNMFRPMIPTITGSNNNCHKKVVYVLISRNSN